MVEYQSAMVVSFFVDGIARKLVVGDICREDKRSKQGSIFRGLCDLPTELSRALTECRCLFAPFGMFFCYRFRRLVDSIGSLESFPVSFRKDPSSSPTIGISENSFSLRRKDYPVFRSDFSSCVACSEPFFSSPANFDSELSRSATWRSMAAT